MWHFGMVDIMFSEDGPLQDSVTLTDLIYDEEAVSKMPVEDQMYLEYLIKVFTRHIND